MPVNMTVHGEPFTVNRIGQIGGKKIDPSAQPRRISLRLLRRHWQISKNLMMSTGTFYDQRAIMETVFDRFNSGTAYGVKMIGNILFGIVRQFLTGL